MISPPYQPAAFTADCDIRFFATFFKPNFHITVNENNFSSETYSQK